MSGVVVLVSYAVGWSGRIPTFRRTLLPPSSLRYITIPLYYLESQPPQHNLLRR